MAYKCDRCQKGKQKGHYVSHAKNRVIRRFKPNLKKVTIYENGKKKVMRLCIKCLKTVKKETYK